MEINPSGNKRIAFYDKIKEDFEKNGYQIPNIIFWNVASRRDTFHASSEQKGVQLLSGQSATVFKTLVSNIDKTPFETMMEALSQPILDLVRI